MTIITGWQPLPKGLSIIIMIILVIAFPLASNAKNLQPESYYQSIFAKSLGGSEEVAMPDGTRCDLVAEAPAIEVDFAAKWS